MKKNKKKELKKIGIENPFLYGIHSRIKSWVLKLKMWYVKKRNEIITNALKGIEKNEWVKRITKEYLQNINYLYRKTHGLNTIYGEIDEYTYKKYCTLRDEYDMKCNKQLKKINSILKLLFNIKPNQDTNHFKKFLNSGKLIVLKGLYKPTLRIIARGNNFRCHREEKSNSDKMSTLTVLLYDEIGDNIICDIEINK